MISRVWTEGNVMKHEHGVWTEGDAMKHEQWSQHATMLKLISWYYWLWGVWIVNLERPYFQKTSAVRIEQANTCSESEIEALGWSSE